MNQGTQRAFYCRCGREKIIANGHCATCYTLRRQDERHFGGLRERVLERDGHRTQAVLSEMPDLLLELWRELHPRGHEQTALDFRWRVAEARPVPLFTEIRAGK